MNLGLFLMLLRRRGRVNIADFGTVTWGVGLAHHYYGSGSLYHRGSMTIVARSASLQPIHPITHFLQFACGGGLFWSKDHKAILDLLNNRRFCLFQGIHGSQVGFA